MASDTLTIVINAKDNASGPLGKVKGSLGGLGKAGALVGKAVVGGLAAAGIAAVGLGAASLKAAGEFDQATKALIVGTGASGDALKAMQDDVMAISNSSAGLGHSMEDVGATIAEVATRTGATGDALQGLSSDILQMTRLTGGDAVQATQKITRVMGDWGVSVDDSRGLVNNLFAAGQTFGIGLDSLAGKLVQFGAPLRQMGFSLEESTAMLGKWEKEGVNTELVIGSLRIAAGHFAKDQIPLKEGLRDTMKAIKGAATESDALNIAMEVFGSRAGPDMAAAIREGRFELDDAIGSLQGMGGALDDAALRSMKLGDKWGLLKKQAANALIPIGKEYLQPMMDSLLGFASDVLPQVVAAFMGFLDTVSAVFSGFSDGFGAGMGNLAEMFGFSPDAVAWIEEAAGVIGEAVSSAYQAISDAIAAFQGGGNTGDIASALGFSDDAVAKINDFIVTLQDGWSQLMDFFAPTIERLQEAIGPMMESFDQLGAKMGPLGEAFTALGVALQPVAEAIGVVLVAAFNLLLEVVAAVMPDLGTIVGNVVDGITIFINTLAEVITDVVALVTALINGDWQAAWDAALSIVTDLTDGIVGILGVWFDTIAVIFGDLIAGVSQWLGNMDNEAQARFDEFIAAAATWATTFLSSVQQMLNDVLAAIKGFSLRDAGRMLIQGMVDGVKSMAGALVSAATGVVQSAIDAAKNLLHIHSPSTVFMQIGIDTIQGLINGIMDMDEKAAKAMASVVSGVVRAAQGLLKFAIDLGTFEVPTQNYQEAIDWLADFAGRLATAVAALKDWNIEFGDDFKTFAANLKAGFAPLVDALRLVDKLHDFSWMKPGEAIPIIDWLASFAGFVAREMSRIAKWGNIDFGEGFKTFSANLKAGFEPLIEALKLVEKLEGFKWLETGTTIPVIDWLASFAGIVGREMTRISKWENIDFGEGFKMFTDNLKQAFGPLKEALAIIGDLASFKWLEPGKAKNVISWLASFAGLMAVEMTRISKWGNIDFGENFKRFTDGIKESFGALSEALKFVDELAMWKGAKGLRGKFTDFRKDWEYIIQEFGKSTKKLKGMVDDDMAKFAKTMGDIAGGLIDAVELLKTDWSKVTVPPATLWAPLFDWIMDVMTEAARYATEEIAPEAMDAASKFGEAIGVLIGGLSDALSFITDLMQTPGSVFGDADRFADLMGLLLQRIDGTIKAFKHYVVDAEGADWIAAANDFVTVLQTVIDTLASGLKLFTDLGSADMPSMSEIDQFVQAILALFSGLQSGITQSASQIHRVVGDIRADLGAGFAEPTIGIAAANPIVTVRHEVKVTSPDGSIGQIDMSTLANELKDYIYADY